VVELLPHQAIALTSDHKYTAITSGVGGGKTWTGVHWVVRMSKEYPKSLGFIGANTFSQLRNSTLAAVFNELMRLEIPFSYNQSSGILEILGKKWLCKSMDNFDVLRGIEVGEIWLDECAYMKEEAFQVISGRLRDRYGALKVLLTSTPKGFNWFFHYMHKDGDCPLPNSKLIRATSMDNSFLPEGYIDSLKSQYDSKLIEQELAGEFINVRTGVIYHGFDKQLHTMECSLPPRFPVYAGMDFNPNRMAVVVGYIKLDTLFVIDEIFDTTPGSNTESVCRKLIAKYGNEVTIVPDSTGIKSTSNSNRSDHQIIRDLGLKIKSATNPFRVDRYNAVNLSFEKGRVFINPKCKNLIRDLEQVSYKDGSDKPDDSDKNLTHMSDALGYLIYRTVNPLQNKSRPIRSQLR